MNKTKDIHDLVVIGAGPAALTAALKIREYLEKEA